jgi:glycosyltransferase involved in cell wall biosynthesis
MAATRARVLHVITQLELGGAQQNTLYTCAHLDRGRFEPLLACGPGGYLDDEARALPDVPVHFVPSLVRPVRPLSDLGALRALVALFRRERPAIVHTHSSKAGIVGRWAARLAGVPKVVHSIHGFGFHDGQRPAVRAAFVAAERWTARATDAFIAVSRANLRQGAALGLFPESKCRVIRSGIALDRFRGASRHAGRLRGELGIAADDPLVGMIACLKPQKAPLDFVATAARVLDRMPRATFVLAGDGELRGDVERAIARVPGGPARIRLLGWRRDTEALLADLDVLLLTSRWEGLPRVIPEAMAAGRPVVATAVDGTPEAVDEGRTGYLAPAGDTVLMAERLVELLASPERRAAMGEAGRVRAEEWDIDAMVRAQEALYEELLGDRAGRGPFESDPVEASAAPGSLS